jgi:hypothetical protein
MVEGLPGSAEEQGSRGEKEKRGGWVVPSAPIPFFASAPHGWVEGSNVLTFKRLNVAIESDDGDG